MPSAWVDNNLFDTWTETRRLILIKSSSIVVAPTYKVLIRYGKMFCSEERHPVRSLYNDEEYLQLTDGMKVKAARSLAAMVVLLDIRVRLENI